MNCRKNTAVLLAVLMIIMLTGCKQTGSNEKSSIVCTVFPQYDWVCQILGDSSGDMDITLLLKSKIDLHNYQPSVDDIVKISSCDLFIYIGGESDGWVENALKEATNKNMVVINLLDVLGEAAKTEEIKEGMENEEHDSAYEDQNENEDHEFGASHEDEDDRETEYDEHVWLSLKNAQVFCKAIANALSALNAEGADTYQRNLTVYTEKLSILDSDYREAVNAAPVKTLLFADRFPFRYLVDDYGLDYYAAFVGCSAETEAGFETIIFLAAKMDELGLKNIMVTESSDQSLAGTVRNNTAEKTQQILVLDAMQSVTMNDAQNSTTYLSLMESNLNVIKEALK